MADGGNPNLDWWIADVVFKTGSPPDSIPNCCWIIQRISFTVQPTTPRNAARVERGCCLSFRNV